MSAHEVTLFVDAFWISPYVFSCFVALREKRVPFEASAVALHEGAQHAAAFRDSSLTGRVPALRSGDFWLAESSAIVEFVDENFASPERPKLLPDDVRARARARQLMAWIRSDLMPIREQRSTHTMFYKRSEAALDAAGLKAAEKLVRVAEAVIPAEGENLFGAWSIADADLAFMLHRLISNNDPVPARVRAWAEGQWARASVQEFVQHARPEYVPY